MEHVLEYQDYLLAYRLRALVGGALRPARRELGLAEYAAKRLERQRLARDLLGRDDYRDDMRRVDALTDELNFGMWHNPGETVALLRKVAAAGGSAALESETGFVEALLTRRERARLGEAGAHRLARYYLALVRASAAYLDPEIFTRLRDEIDPGRPDLPIFVELGEGEDATPA
ncbi:MAG: hypothetical protein RI554_09580 [Trueperaceae bacterium]|nr:hypothetical protein [Trueperaceae bacterium]